MKKATRLLALLLAALRHNNSTRKVNRLWLWLGVLILVFILLWWLYSIGTFEALTGVANG